MFSFVFELSASDFAFPTAVSAARSSFRPQLQAGRHFFDRSAEGLSFRFRQCFCVAISHVSGRSNIPALESREK